MYTYLGQGDGPMGGYGRPGQTTGGGYCSIWFLGLTIIPLLALAGCAHTPGPTTRCVTREQFEQIKRDEPPKIADRLTGNAAEDIKPIAGSAVRLRSWGRGMLGILEGCTSAK